MYNVMLFSSIVLMMDVIMTQTKQPRSLAYLSESEKNPDKNTPETEDNMALLLSVYDSLNKLCDRLNRLIYLLKRKSVVQISNHEHEGEEK